MFAVMYRWKRKPGTEEIFREAWRAGTVAVTARSGTGGSRLHRTDDGYFVAYAIWPSRQHWEEGSKLPSASPEAGARIAECMAEPLATTPLDIVADLLRPLP